VPVRADSKSEDRQLIVDRQWLPIQTQPILAESVYVAGQIWAETGQRIRVQPHSFECRSSIYVKTFSNFSEDVRYSKSPRCLRDALNYGGVLEKAIAGLLRSDHISSKYFSDLFISHRTRNFSTAVVHRKSDRRAL
jgi:hypothetical protein